MTGHIKLGDKGALRDYILSDPTRRRRKLANQMAAKIGQGAGEYTDFQNWSYFVTASWRSGVGRIDPDDGGFFYSTSETRFNQRLMLPPKITPTGRRSAASANANFSPVSSMSVEVEVEGTTYEKVALPYQADGTVSELWVMLETGYGEIEPVCSVYSGATEPTTLVATGTMAQQTQTKGYEYLRVQVTSHTAASGTQYWLVLEPPVGESFKIPMTETVAGTGVAKYLNGGTWADLTYNSASLYGVIMAPVPALGGVTCAAEFNNTIYAGDENGNLWKWVSGSDVWQQVGTTLDAPCTDMERWMGKLWVAVGPNDYAYSVATDDTVTQQAWAAEHFAVGFGYLWRTLKNSAYYDSTAGLASWSTAVVVGSDDYSINAIAPLGQDMYVSTSQALWRIGAGDYVYGVTLWGYYEDSNGEGMINHQGSLYAPQGNVIWRISENTPLLNIWSREEALPAGRSGTVKSIAGTNRELFALIEPSDSTGPPSVWSWNAEGWHFVAQLPPGVGAGHIIYDANTECVWVFDRTGHAWNIRTPLNIPTPQQDGAAVFTPTSWIEFGSYYGNLKDIVKDFDSVTVLGDNLSASNYVEVWYRTSETTLADITTEDGVALTTEDGETIAAEVNAWSYLGSITSSGQRIRWTDYSVRPTSIDLSIGLKIVTTEESLSPVVRAIVVRYHPTIADRYRWRLPITVQDRQQMLDGSINAYGYDAQVAHLEAMQKREQPIIYQDIDGVQYEVKIIDSDDYVMKFEYYDTGFHMVSEFSLVLEQITDEVYTA